MNKRAGRTLPKLLLIAVGLTLYVARRHVDAEQPRPRAP